MNGSRAGVKKVAIAGVGKPHSARKLRIDDWVQSNK